MNVRHHKSEQDIFVTFKNINIDIIHIIYHIVNKDNNYKNIFNFNW